MRFYGLQKKKSAWKKADFPSALRHCCGREAQTAAEEECSLISYSFCCRDCQVNPKDRAIDLLLFSQALGKPWWPRFTKERTIQRREQKEIPERILNFQGLRDACYQYLACVLHCEKWNLHFGLVSGVVQRYWDIRKSPGEGTVWATVVKTLQT